MPLSRSCFNFSPCQQHTPTHAPAHGHTACSVAVHTRSCASARRLGVCALVCRSFHAAAVAATHSISIMSMSTQGQCDELSEWLQRHGSDVTALKAQCRGWTRLEISPSLASSPCPVLRDLNLYGLYLQPGFFSACTSLTRLILDVCDIESSPNVASSANSHPLSQLSVLGCLQHLGLSIVRSECSAARGDSLAFPSSLLSHLVQLTYLLLSDIQVQSDAALQHLSTVSGLQHLELKVYGHQRLTPAAFTGLQHLPHLTALRLGQLPWAVNLHSMPTLTVLTALRVLQLRDITSVDPAVLAWCSQLQDVNLQCEEAWDAEGSAALLTVIGQRPQLKRLELCPCSSWYPPPAAAFSALTASSCLQHLELTDCQLPACAWQQMFPPGRCLPELCYLGMGFIISEEPAWQLRPADMQAMVSCCPALAYLYLGSRLTVSTAAPLQQLTGLTTLSIYASFQDNAPSVARLTGLQEMFLDARLAGERVTVSGLLQLTVLQQLSYMAVRAAAFDRGLDPVEGLFGNDDMVTIFDKAPAGAPPDVWLQLKECCEVAQQVQAGCVSG